MNICTLSTYHNNNNKIKLRIFGIRSHFRRYVATRIVATVFKIAHPTYGVPRSLMVAIL